MCFSFFLECRCRSALVYDGRLLQRILSRQDSAERSTWLDQSFTLTIDIDYRYHRPMAKPADILPGTLDLLILKTLELGPRHGVAIADRIEQVTRGVFLVGPGSLFPALHRLTEKGWIVGGWTESETKRRVKAYTLTASGRAQLAAEKRNWRNVLVAMNRVLAEET